MRCWTQFECCYAGHGYVGYMVAEFAFLTYLLHGAESNWFAASQEIPRISRNPKVHYRTHKRPPPVYPGPAQSNTHIPPPGDPS